MTNVHIQPPICTDRALELSWKDSNIRYLDHLGNSDIAVFLAVRAWFLDAVRTWCPEVLEDLRRAVYVPLEARVGRDDAAVLLRSTLPNNREVETGILRWAPTMEAGHRLDSRRSLAHAAVLGGHTRATLGEKTTGCDGRLSLTRGFWRVRRPCVGPVTVPSWSGSCGCGCVGRPWRHATSPPNTMLRRTPSASGSTSSRNHSTFPCAPAAAPGPHRVEATPPKHVHIPEHVHILGRGIRRML